MLEKALAGFYIHYLAKWFNRFSMLRDSHTMHSPGF